MDDKKKAKIGTLTFHKSLNYGSFLQAYALQQKLIQKGYDIEIIDFEPKGFKQLYSDLLLPINKRNLIYDYVHLVLWKHIQSRKKSFAKATKRLLRLSSRKYNHRSGLRGADGRYDVIICGSDQIWNAHARDFDISYMLPDITSSKKAAYAVSINAGKYEGCRSEQEIRTCLGGFDVISTREKDGKGYLEGFLDGSKKVDVMIDPTFLLSSEMYDKLIEERRVKEPYIFLFSINFKDPVRKVAAELSKRLNLPVYTLFSGRGTRNSIKAQKEFNMLSGDVGPECFLNLVKHADYVVADSFHGTAFSVIFRKPFISVYAEEKDIRINHVLSLLNLEERYIRPSDVQHFNVTQAIDYAGIEPVLTDQISKAERFLDHILEDTE